MELFEAVELRCSGRPPPIRSRWRRDYEAVLVNVDEVLDWHVAVKWLGGDAGSRWR